MESIAEINEAEEEISELQCDGNHCHTQNKEKRKKRNENSLRDL